MAGSGVAVPGSTRGFPPNDARSDGQQSTRPSLEAASIWGGSTRRLPSVACTRGHLLKQATGPPGTANATEGEDLIAGQLGHGYQGPARGARSADGTLYPRLSAGAETRAQSGESKDTGRQCGAESPDLDVPRPGEDLNRPPQETPKSKAGQKTQNSRDVSNRNR